MSSVNEAAVHNIQILSRGVYPGGGGEVEFSCPVVRRMKPVQMMDCGKVRRVRGIAYPYCDTSIFNSHSEDIIIQLCTPPMVHYYILSSY